MANIQVAALNRAVDGLAGDVTHLSLHTNDGGASGTGELSGGDYARQTVTYSSASGGESDISDDAVFGGASSQQTVTHVGFWDGSTWLAGSPLTTSKVVDPEDTLTVTSAPITISAA